MGIHHHLAAGLGEALSNSVLYFINSVLDFISSESERYEVTNKNSLL
jgi:hypothetical protein